jgi:dephospho-CoA kinase
MFANKPIIGIAGGIGSGKSYVAQIFGELGALVICSDDQVRQVYERAEVKRTLREWWGESVFLPTGQVNRRTVAHQVFADPQQRTRLEQLIHPLVAEARDEVMAAKQDDPGVSAFIWDTPLLFEAGLNKQCDAVVFVDAPLSDRLARVQKQRNWDAAELARRENSQWPLDRKRELADYVINNSANADPVRDQVKRIFSQIHDKN